MTTAITAAIKFTWPGGGGPLLLSAKHPTSPKFGIPAPPGGPPPGYAATGHIADVVTLSNGDDTNVVSWKWECLSVPMDSAVPTGEMATTSTTSFTPDTRWSYGFRLTVRAADGTTAVDERVFGVPDRGWLIPAFGMAGTAHNFGGQVRGWAGSSDMADNDDNKFVMLDEMLEMTLAEISPRLWWSFSDIAATTVGETHWGGYGDGEYNVGVKFCFGGWVPRFGMYPSVAGVRFYACFQGLTEDPVNPCSARVTLWDSHGMMLAAADVSDISGRSIQEVYFPAPVPLPRCGYYYVAVVNTAYGVGDDWSFPSITSDAEMPHPADIKPMMGPGIQFVSFCYANAEPPSKSKVEGPKLGYVGSVDVWPGENEGVRGEGVIGFPVEPILVPTLDYLGPPPPSL